MARFRPSSSASSSQGRSPHTPSRFSSRRSSRRPARNGGRVPRQSAPVPVGSAASTRSTAATTGKGRHIARILAGVLLVVLAVAAVTLSALSMFNWSAQRSYESASARLRGNVAAARSGSRTTADIQVSQQQVDADLEDLSSSSAVQVRPISSAVRTASATSRRLDSVLALMAKGRTWAQATKEAARKSAKSGSGASTPNTRQKKSPTQKSSGNGTKGTKSDDQEAKEQEEQKKKLDRLISRTQSSTDSTTKPW